MITDDVISPALMRKMPIFRGFNESECHQLSEIASVVGFKPGEMVLKQGEKCQNMWVLLEGKCEVYRVLNPSDPKSESVPLAGLEPYSHFGEMSFFHPAPHSASVRAETAVKLMRINRGDYQDLIADGVSAAYKLAYNCVEGLADRLRRMDEWVASLLKDQPEVVQDVPEWTNFCEKLFDRWNL